MPNRIGQPSVTDQPSIDDIRRGAWRLVLLIMSMQPNGCISTAELVAELPKYLELMGWEPLALFGQVDDALAQFVRNFKSHKRLRSSFIYQGYAEDTHEGIRITPKGRRFVDWYFKAARPFPDGR